MLLCEKYTPYTLNGFVGNADAITKLKEFGNTVQQGKRPKPIIVYGPSGTGKTSAVRALAASNGFELLELNASDYRDFETLKKKLLPAASSRGLFNSTVLILFDEIDELSKQFDKGAESAVAQLLREAKQPVVFTANNFWNQRISFLREHVDRVEFKKVSKSTIFEYLKKIAKSEKKAIDDSVLAELAERSDGDVRGAINDLEVVLYGSADIMQNLGIRSHKLEIFRVLDKVFTSNSFFEAKSAVDNADTDLGMLLNWVEENVPSRYSVKSDMDNAYATLADASRFYEMAERVRYYGYLRYAAVLASSGVSLSGEGRARFIAPYAFPSKIKYLSATKAKRNIESNIAEKLRVLHTNKKEIIASYIPLFKILWKEAGEKRREELSEVFEALELEKEERSYIIS